MKHRYMLVDEFKEWQFDSVLDVGCGEGIDIGFLKKEFPTALISGVDSDSARIQKAKLSFPDIRLEVCDAEKMPFGDKTFDLVFTDALFVQIENTGKVIRIIREMERIAKKYLCFLETHSGRANNQFQAGIHSSIFGIPDNQFNYYHVRDYNELLARFNNVETIKIPKEYWRGQPWEEFGYIIKAEI